MNRHKTEAEVPALDPFLYGYAIGSKFIPLGMNSGYSDHHFPNSGAPFRRNPGLSTHLVAEGWDLCAVELMAQLQPVGAV